jgi:hypothetical protein
MDPKDLAQFVFFSSCPPGSNMALSTTELADVMTMLHGDDFLSTNLRPKIVKYQKKMISNHRPCTMSDFEQLCHEVPAIIIPVMRLQLDLKEKLLGTDFWGMLSLRRYAVPKTETQGFVLEISKDAMHATALMKKKKEVPRRRGSVAILIDHMQKMVPVHGFKANKKVIVTSTFEEHLPQRARRRRSLSKGKGNAEPDDDNLVFTQEMIDMCSNTPQKHKKKNAKYGENAAVGSPLEVTMTENSEFTSGDGAEWKPAFKSVPRGQSSPFGRSRDCSPAGSPRGGSPRGSPRSTPRIGNPQGKSNSSPRGSPRVGKNISSPRVSGSPSRNNDVSPCNSPRS